MGTARGAARAYAGPAKTNRNTEMIIKLIDFIFLSSLCKQQVEKIAYSTFKFKAALLVEDKKQDYQLIRF
jgi:hypothetical protein